MYDMLMYWYLGDFCCCFWIGIFVNSPSFVKLRVFADVLVVIVWRAGFPLHVEDWVGFLFMRILRHFFLFFLSLSLFPWTVFCRAEMHFPHSLRRFQMAPVDKAVNQTWSVSDDLRGADPIAQQQQTKPLVCFFRVSGSNMNVFPRF